MKKIQKIINIFSFLKGDLNNFDLYNQILRILSINSNFHNTIFIFVLIIILYKNNKQIDLERNNFIDFFTNIQTINSNITQAPFYNNFLENIKRIIKLNEDSKFLYENPLDFMSLFFKNLLISFLNQPITIIFSIFFNRLI
jgi:hypothetical protein